MTRAQALLAARIMLDAGVTLEDFRPGLTCHQAIVAARSLRSIGATARGIGATARGIGEVLSVHPRIVEALLA